MPVKASKREAELYQLNLDGGAEEVRNKPRNRKREEKMQRLLFQYRERMLPKYPLLRFLFATWNGIPLPPQMVNRLAGLGLKGSKGVFDLWLPVRRFRENGGVVCGLAIDMKAWTEGRVSKEQREWQSHLLAQGWDAYFEPSALGAWQRIAAHLGIEGEDFEAKELAHQERWLRLQEG